MPMLPPDHPHNQPRALGRIHNPPSTSTSPRKSKDVKEARPKDLHKKTLSSISLRSLGKDKDTEERHAREPSRSRAEKDAAKNPKKPKSSTNLAAVFQKSKTSKEDKRASQYLRDKENTTPPGSAVAPQVQTPIWAQFSSQQEVRTTTTIPLNDRRSIEAEIARYTPTEYSPSKGRDFMDYGGPPSLQKRPVSKERPKSSFLPSSGSTSNFMESISRKISGDRVPLSSAKGNEMHPKEDPNSRAAKTRSLIIGRTSSDGRKSTDEKARPEPTVGQKTNRVMATVAVFNGKSKDAEGEMTTPLDPKVVEKEFEAVLVCFYHLRN